MKRIVSTVCLLIFLSIEAFGADALEVGFKNPPPKAQAYTWWHWINGNVSKEGITADLESMKRVGIHGVQLFNVTLKDPAGPAPYLGEEWLDLFKFSAQEAQRLGLELGFHNCPGWSSSGGPWVTPEYAMQHLVFSEVFHRGGQVFKGKLPQPAIKLNYYNDIAVLAFPKPQGDERIDELDIKILSERIRNHLAPDATPVPTAALVRKEEIIDLTSNLTADGKLEWDAPEGEWVILRLGHTPTGSMNRFASAGGRGLECDKMSRKAVDLFWKGGVTPIIDKLGPLIGSVVTKCHIDSYEVGTSNWTSDFAREFKRLRTYECLPWLPALAGYYVESGEETERFLWDFRRTIGDLTATHYYGRFSELCHQHGMKFSVEPYWGPFDNMQVGATADLVMAEFWSGSLAFFDSPKFVASIAKLDGSPLAEAEAFTAMGGWNEHPASLKAIGDMAWAQGINRFVFHTYVHQPWEIGPGLTLGPFGIDFNRLNTWWEQGIGFMDYIGRGQFLLQQGESYADILVFTGESSPNDGLLIPQIKALGYDYDLIGKNKIGELSVKDGLICTPHGAAYQVLVLPETTWMTPETMAVIENLAQSGATLFGTQPQKSPSLQDYPQCDERVAQGAATLQSDRLLQEGSIIDFLTYGDMPPDFSIEGGDQENIDFIHRKTKEADIYFVANARKEHREKVCRFRVAGKQPELWNAETGEINNAVVWQDNGDGTTTLPIPFEPEGSVFVVFRKPIASAEHLVKTSVELNRPPAVPLQHFQLVKAEYGIFLPDGLTDVTEAVRAGIKNNRLQTIANRNLCDGDPAPGYKKELRIEYQIGDTVLEMNAMELEPVVIDPDGKGRLKILKAVFGKFAQGTRGIPSGEPARDVTKQLEALIAAGTLEIPVSDRWGNHSDESALRVMYSADGMEHQKTATRGQTLNLSQRRPGSIISSENGQATWITPYPGKLTVHTTSGNTKTIQVPSVPEPVELKGSWNVHFPSMTKTTFDELISWSDSSDTNIRYFSGTASYRKQFNLPQPLLDSNTSLELDLGTVCVIAEVIVNGKNLGILWKAPFTVNLDGAVQAGENTLEVRITNLWPNRLIGDEQLPNDIERRGPNVKQWPDWLLNNFQRPTERVTFAGFKHWNKDSQPQPSGLLGPVIIRSYARTEIEY
ncbi:glycosyl hydrolase [Pontiellaceae bacterium B12227]|nr:glycosyl hydrolase [Pontiellaceae bacterium B12227]